MEEHDYRKEKIERVTLVLGIFTASVIGFAINIFTNIYCDVFLTETKKITDYNQIAMVIPVLVFIFSVAFLSFLVYDHQNGLNLDRSFFKRFSDYYGNVFWMSRLTKKLMHIVFFIGKWLMAIVIGLSLYKGSGTKALFIWVGTIVFWFAIKYLYKRRSKLNLYLVKFYKQATKLDEGI